MALAKHLQTNLTTTKRKNLHSYEILQICNDLIEKNIFIQILLFLTQLINLYSLSSQFYAKCSMNKKWPCRQHKYDF